MILHLLLHSADASSLGRFEAWSLPQQPQMEYVFAQLDDVVIAKDDCRNFLDIHCWSILTFDANDKVDSITIHQHLRFDYLNKTIRTHEFGPGGTLNFDFVPESVTLIDITNSRYSGTVSTGRLPPGLLVLRINGNKFHGEFDTKALPKEIQIIVIANNAFHGSLAMDSLPNSVEEFYASLNGFSGELNLSALPPKLSTLYLTDNNFRGKLVMRNVPETLEQVCLNNNAFDRDRMVIASRSFVYFRVDAEFRGNIFSPDGVQFTPEGLHFGDTNDEASHSDEFALGDDFGDW